jgi:hypothetical protein
MGPLSNEVASFPSIIETQSAIAIGVGVEDMRVDCLGKRDCGLLGTLGDNMVTTYV